MELNSKPSTRSCFTCALYFDDQLSFVLHLHERHLLSTMKLDFNVATDQKQIYCQLCSECFGSERDHETRHFSTKIGVGSLIECSHCCRTFKTLDQMKDHRRMVHEANQLKPDKEQCCVCFRFFKNRNLRDQHLVSHISSLVTRLMDRIDELQSKFADSYTSNLCPLCGHIVSTRKSLKQHAIFQHLFRSQNDMELLLGKSKLTDLEDAELHVVRKLIANPGLLWKLQVAKPKAKTRKKTTIVRCKSKPLVDECMVMGVKKESQPSG